MIDRSRVGQHDSHIRTAVIALPILDAIADVCTWQNINSRIVVECSANAVTQLLHQLLMLDVRKRRHDVNPVPDLIPAIAATGAAALEQLLFHAWIDHQSRHSVPL